MQRVTGVGGVFFKSKDPERLFAWYEKHLGVTRDPASGGSSVVFRWHDDHDGDGMTAWSIFRDNTKYFEPSQSSFMINYRVADMDALLAALREEGIKIEHEDSEYGRFAWVVDPDGNKIELWEPPKE